MRFLKALSIFFTGAAAPVAVANAATVVKVDMEGHQDKDLFRRRFEMEGHSYIYFMEKGTEGIKQIIHDPDCKCLKK